MIKFFRKIRQKLLSEGKTGKYFKYAIGEIVLVMVGILLALQVNNWNESKKEIKFEQQALIEIRNSLQADLNFFAVLLKRVKDKSQAIQLLIDMSAKDESEIDMEAFDKKIVAESSYGISLAYDAGPYEALKSTGLNKIGNNDLKESVVRLYEVLLPRTAEFIESKENEIRKDTDRLWDQLYEQGMIKTEFIKNEKNEWILNEYPATGLFSSPIFIEKLKFEMKLANYYNYRMAPIIKESSIVLNQINQELSK